MTATVLTADEGALIRNADTSSRISQPTACWCRRSVPPGEGGARLGHRARRAELVLGPGYPLTGPDRSDAGSARGRS